MVQLLLLHVKDITATNKSKRQGIGIGFILFMAATERGEAVSKS